MSTTTARATRAQPNNPTSGELAALIGERARVLGDRAYLEHARGGTSLTFGALAEVVSEWATALHRSAVPVGSVVGLLVADPLTFAGAFLGTIASGRWAAPLDPGMPAHGAGGLAIALSRVQAGVVLADAPEPSGMEVRWLHRDLLRADSDADTEEVDGSTPHGAPGGGGAVLASSGTTGAPKVVPLSEHQLLHTARSVAAHHGLTPDDRGFNSLPLFHINAEVVGLLANLVAGSCLVLDDRFHRTNFWRVMDERKISWINAVPAIISRLADPADDESIPAGIRFIRSASAPLPAATAARFEANTGIPVVETYGMTEAASQITANPVDGVRKPGSVGRPVGVELRIVEDEAWLADSDTPATLGTGHVEIRGPSVITAYGGGLHGDRFDAHGWLRTGDLGHFDADGYLYLDARVDDVINRGGEKVFPREIEEMILLDPDITSAVVVAAEDHELGQVPEAFLVVQDVAGGADVTTASAVAARVREHLETALVKAKRPVALTVVEAMPAGATGKVRRRALHGDDVRVLYRLACR